MSACAGQPHGGRDRLGPGRGRAVVIDAGERRVDGDHAAARSCADQATRSASRARTAAPARGNSRARARGEDAGGEVAVQIDVARRVLAARARARRGSRGHQPDRRRPARVPRRAAAPARSTASTLAGSSPWTPPTTSSGRPAARSGASDGPPLGRPPELVEPEGVDRGEEGSDHVDPHFTLRLTSAQWASSWGPEDRGPDAAARRGLRAALAAYDHMLAINPLDYDSRRKIADMLPGWAIRPRRPRSTAPSRCTTSARATRCRPRRLQAARGARRHRRRHGRHLAAGRTRRARRRWRSSRPGRRRSTWTPSRPPDPHRRGDVAALAAARAGAGAGPLRCSCSTPSSSCRCPSSPSCRATLFPPACVRCAAFAPRRRVGHPARASPAWRSTWWRRARCAWLRAQAGQQDRRARAPARGRRCSARWP